jgi:hypothetical protein
MGWNKEGGLERMNSENILKIIDEIWEDNRPGFEKKLSRWLHDLQNGNEVYKDVKKEFHVWKPFMAYLSVYRTKKSKQVAFSLRFHGQEVAEIIVKNKKVCVKLKENHIRSNKRDFDLVLQKNSFPWNSDEARKFRKYFKTFAVSKNNMPEVKSPEHRIESKFLNEMCKGSEKFGMKGLMIKPVMIADKFFFQMPVPISANTGEPKASDGNIDILARRRLKNKTNLSVWELKKPKAYKNTASEAFIYSAVLLKIFRHSQKGSEWFKWCGFSKMPESIEIDTIVAIDRSSQQKFAEEMKMLGDSKTFKIGKDLITFFPAYYEEKEDGIVFKPDSFKS